MNETDLSITLKKYANKVVRVNNGEELQEIVKSIKIDLRKVYFEGRCELCQFAKEHDDSRIRCEKHGVLKKTQVCHEFNLR